jgi:hypothetical protein
MQQFVLIKIVQRYFKEIVKFSVFVSFMIGFLQSTIFFPWLETYLSLFTFSIVAPTLIRLVPSARKMHDRD